MKHFTPQRGYVRMTRQYVGGMFGGFGLCLVAMRFLVRAQGPAVLESYLLILVAFLFIAIGSSLALSEQRRLEEERENRP